MAKTPWATFLSLNSMSLVSASLTQLAPKVAVLCEITRNDGHWAVQGHSRSPIVWYRSKAGSRPMTGVLSPTGASYHGVSALKLSLLRVSVFNSSFGVNPWALESWLQHLASKKLETPLRRALLWTRYFDILICLGADHQCDRQTDRQTRAKRCRPIS